jgi:peptide/nickel transport system permease protein
MPSRTLASVGPDVRLAVAWLGALALVAILAVPLFRDAASASENARGPWRTAFRRFRSTRSARIGLTIIIALYVIALLAPVLEPYDPERLLDTIGLVGMPPSLAHPLGTDLTSRDVLSRIIDGARISLSVGFLAVLLSMTVGTLYGAIAGFAGGLTDTVMMRIIDALLSVPRILILIAITSLWDSLSLPALIVLIGLTGWFGVSRIVRGQVLALSTREFVVSARALGAGGWHVLGRHILPNVLSPVIVAATLGVSNVIILETGLSYLNLGVEPPQASWGSIITDGSEQVAAVWWISLFPGLAIMLTVMAFNIVGDGLRDAFDPR